VYEIVPTNLTFGHFFCASQKPSGSGGGVTFNLRQSTTSGGNFGTPTTIATCTVTNGNISGSSTGTVSLVGTDVYDIQVIGVGAPAGGVTASLGP
jgi:hypothetical protein